jgi:WD40 repeat protein
MKVSAHGVEPSNQVASVSYSADGSRLAIAEGHYPPDASQDCDIKFCDPVNGQMISVFANEPSRINQILFSPIASTTLASAIYANALNFREVPNPAPTKKNTHVGEVTCVAFSVDGTAWACGYLDGYVETSLHGPWSAHGIQSRLSSISFRSPPEGGLQVATASSAVDETAIHLWDAATGQFMGDLNEAGGGITAVCFSRDGAVLISGHPDGSIKCFDMSLKTSIWNQPGEPGDGDVTSITFRPDPSGIYFATGALGTDFGTIRNIHLRSLSDRGNVVAILPGHGGGIQSLAFRPTNGEYIASGGKDGSVPRVQHVSLP